MLHLELIWDICINLTILGFTGNTGKLFTQQAKILTDNVVFLLKYLAATSIR